MAVNNNFYITVNELVSLASGKPAGIVDYSTFMDYGKSLANSLPQDFANAFAAEIANKVRLSINTARDLDPQLTSLIRGQVAPNGVIEIITNLFFETRAAAFVSLTNDSSVDQYVINKGGQNVNYYTKDNSYQIPVTIQYTEIEGAFLSPEAMNRFLEGKIKYAMNTNTEARTEGRRGILADMIVELDGQSGATSVEAAAQKYEVVSLFNDMYDLSGDDALTSDNALYNAEFVKFLTALIKKVSKKVSNPSTSFNTSGIKTFTPDNSDDKKLITNTAFDSSLVAFKSTLSPDATELGEHEQVAFWLSEADPFTVATQKSAVDVIHVKKDADRGTDTSKVYHVLSTGKYYTYANSAYTEITDFSSYVDVSSPIVAVLFDKYACGEFVCKENVYTTPFNAAGEYYNNWINVQTKYVRNKDANAIVFTLD